MNEKKQTIQANKVSTIYARSSKSVEKYFDFTQKPIPARKDKMAGTYFTAGFLLKNLFKIRVINTARILVI